MVAHGDGPDFGRAGGVGKGGSIPRREFFGGVLGAASLALAPVAGTARGSGALRSGSPWRPPEDEPIDRAAMTPRRLQINPGDDLSQHVLEADSGELLVVPPGSYAWNHPVLITRDHFGVCGEGDLDVTIRIPGGVGHDARWHLFTNNGHNFLFENLVIESEGTACPRCASAGGGDGLFHRLQFRTKEGPDFSFAEPGKVFAASTRAGAHLMLDSITYHNRGNLTYRSHGFLWASSPGDLTVRNCVITGFSDNGVYTRMPGRMTVQNCVFANITPSAIRIGGDNEVVRHCTFWMDTSRGQLHNLDASQGGTAVNTSGIMADRRERASDGGTVEHCSFLVLRTPFATGAVRMFDNRRLTLRHCQFLLNQSNIPAIGVQNPVDELRVEHCVFVTENASGATVARPIRGRYRASGNAIGPGLVPGALAADAPAVAFDWDRAHRFPDDADFRFLSPPPNA